MKKAFTLIEVTLAMLIMAGGILSIVGLYSFGFNENSQSRADVASAAFADQIIAPLIMQISSTQLKWSTFCDAFRVNDDGLRCILPNKGGDSKGWMAYCDNGQVKTDPWNEANSLYRDLKNKLKGDTQIDSPDLNLKNAELTFGLVVSRDAGSGVVRIVVHIVPEKQYGQLLAMPMYYAEARFQGDPNN